jgi:hypothetical protein
LHRTTQFFEASWAERLLDFHSEVAGNRENILIAPSAHVHNEEITAGQGRRELCHISERVRRFERRYDAFEARSYLLFM